MIFLCYNSRENSSIKICEQWFASHNLEFKIIEFKNFTPKELNHILHLTNSGISEIIKKGERTTNIFNECQIGQTTSFSLLISFLLEYPIVLKSPIIFDEERLLVGYDKSDIRQFIPREERLISRQEKKNVPNSK
ncbi:MULTISPECIES: ArsC/Spx/MgsR family protein [unclassified Lactococcus]|uniref:ArsC/Spx/MgsR family protein n=1 Tax=unclassified Lactococcus TaxID=2643510 RepID=UPI0011C74CA7|nr:MULTISPECIES: ArsC/Spx/MgsR family protein [unclassified Lactococcus]MQW23446.1 hypothetical protein [Lactococcus sp. dk101]TXK37042.1 hypothetical protein FVP42_09970 [Lactococcus sp. dk310]TXK37274.1 hypothetical protein FVP42_09200 [Lactococcus sp. dk310]TXK46072.1 hypothetical protein FVP43_11175 [Lactococcus sp. dk322]